MKKCTKCGAELKNDALFCQECGTCCAQKNSKRVLDGVAEIVAQHLKFAEREGVTTEFLSSSNFEPELTLCSTSEGGRASTLALMIYANGADSDDGEFLLDAWRDSPYLDLIQPVPGYDLHEGDELRGIIDFVGNAESATYTISAILRDVFEHKVHMPIEYRTVSDSHKRLAASSNYLQAQGHSSCLSVFLAVALLIVLVLGVL